MKKIFIALLLVFVVQAHSQEISLEYALGYGTYELEDLRGLQDWISMSSMLGDIKLEDTESFPAHITHNIAIGHILKQHHFGIDFSYYTTGSRLHWADYSGFYSIDMILNGYRVGGFYNYSFIKTPSPVNLCLQLGSGIVVSNLEIKEDLTVYSNSLNETDKLEGIGGYIEPAFICKYRLLDRLNFLIHIGYEFDFRGVLKVDGNETYLSAHWNGLRMSGGLAFLIPTKL
ncbi:MAG: hypothetical protein PF444_07080 [Bacteroidales bacterium]|jgi:hypothetical protein|nr:hypothetical protein [Bacteroidales bacterium]